MSAIDVPAGTIPLWLKIAVSSVFGCLVLVIAIVTIAPDEDVPVRETITSQPDEAFPAYHFSETDALERISRTGLGMTAATSRTESPDSFSGGNSASSVFPGPKSAVIFTLADGNVWRIRFGSGSTSSCSSLPDPKAFAAGAISVIEPNAPQNEISAAVSVLAAAIGKSGNGDIAVAHVGRSVLKAVRIGNCVDHVSATVLPKS